MRFIGIFESITHASIRDCVEHGETLIFLVNPGEVGKAIGKKGANIERASKLFQRKVEVVEWSDNLEEFVKLLFLPARIKSVTLGELKSGGKKATVVPFEQDQGLAIGRNGRTIEKARLLLKRYHGIDWVEVKS
jgi:N utilization substance protein A